MSRAKIFLLVCFLNFVQSPQVIAQDRFQSETVQGYELSLRNIMFDSTSGNVYVIPLRKYGLKKSNYAVMVNAFLKGDSTSFHIPGRLKNGDSFGFRLKVGNRRSGDTLTIVRRTGNQRVVFSKITVMAFRGNNALGLIRYNRAFADFLLNRYFRSKSQPSSFSGAYFVLD